MFQWLVDVLMRVGEVIIWRLLPVIIKLCLGVTCLVIGVWFSRQWTQAQSIPNRAFIILTSFVIVLWYALLFMINVLMAFFMAGSQSSTGILATAFRFWSSSKRRPGFVKHYNRCWVQTEIVLERIGSIFKLLPFNWKEY